MNQKEDTKDLVNIEIINHHNEFKETILESIIHIFSVHGFDLESDVKYLSEDIKNRLQSECIEFNILKKRTNELY